MDVYIYVRHDMTKVSSKKRMIFYPAAGFFLIDYRPPLHGDFLVPFLFVEFGGFYWNWNVANQLYIYIYRSWFYILI